MDFKFYNQAAKKRAFLSTAFAQSPLLTMFTRSFGALSWLPPFDRQVPWLLRYLLFFGDWGLLYGHKKVAGASSSILS